MTDVNRQKDLVRRFVEACNTRDYAALREVISADFERHCPATPDIAVRSAEDFVAFQEAEAAIFPDNHGQLDELVAEGDRVAFWGTYTGTQHGPMGPFPPSGRRLSCEFAGVFRTRGDRIVRVQLTWDHVGVLVQLGHMTPPA